MASLREAWLEYVRQQPIDVRMRCATRIADLERTVLKLEPDFRRLTETVADPPVPAWLPEEQR
jgi:hypothetical protein